ncbi:resuscitation-promoting factor RpfA, partial [Mycobacterium rhizamassiliense]
VPPPADAPLPAPPADAPAPAEPQQAINVGYTQQVWDAIRGGNINGNDALDSLALSGPAN